MSAGRLLLPQALSRIRSSKNQLLLASISRGFLFSSSRHFSNSSHASRTAPFPSTQLRSFFRPQTFSLTRPIQLIATPRCVSLPAGSTGQPLFNVQKRFKCSKKPWFKPYKLKSHSGTKKRFKVVASGKFMRMPAGKVHKNRKKSGGRLRRLKQWRVVTHTKIIKRLKRALPYGKGI